MHAQSNHIENIESIDVKIENDLNVYFSLIEEISASQKQLLFELLKERHEQVFNNDSQRAAYKELYETKIKENFKAEVCNKLFNDLNFKEKILNNI